MGNSDSTTRLKGGGSRLKRVTLKIKSARTQTLETGYALVSEMNKGPLLPFFSSKKFLEDDVLEISTTLNGESQVFHVTLRACHEHISSGRILTAIPQEGETLPHLTFYRCYGTLNTALAAPVGVLPAGETAPKETIELTENVAAAA